MDTATVTDSASRGSVTTVCTASPPPPGSHFSRVGWSHSDRISSNVSPPSVDRNRPPGSVPAYTTPGASAPAGCNCQTRSSEVPVSFGYFTGCCVGSSHVAPRSSEWKTDGPQWALSPPASTRGAAPRVSMPTE